MDITLSDVLATTLLGVRIGPRATRRILQDGQTRFALLCKLADVPDVDLGSAGAPELTAMAALYEAVKLALSADTVMNPNAWVTASKLCARKRPDLFPVRDHLVCDHLGLSHFRNYQVDWQVFRALISDLDVAATIDSVGKALEVIPGEMKLQVDHSRLRLLDAAIWTYTKSSS